MEYFDFSKKLYVYGLLDKTKGKTKINKEDIIEYVEELYIPYEYKEINIYSIQKMSKEDSEIDIIKDFLKSRGYKNALEGLEKDDYKTIEKKKVTK